MSKKAVCKLCDGLQLVYTGGMTNVNSIRILSVTENLIVCKLYSLQPSRVLWLVVEHSLESSANSHFIVVFHSHGYMCHICGYSPVNVQLLVQFCCDPSGAPDNPSGATLPIKGLDRTWLVGTWCLAFSL